MSNIDIKARLNSRVAQHFANVDQATRLVKGFLLTGGALAAGVAQFSDIAATGPTASQVIGIIGCIVVFTSAVWVTVKDQDSTEELRIAFDAQKECDELSDGIVDLYGVYEDLEKSQNLIVINHIIRGLLEHSCSNIAMTSENFVDRVFENTKRHLSLAMGFVGNDEWTICVYVAERSADARDRLRLLGHARAIECAKDTARTWEEGVGVAGICYATGIEAIVPDLQSDKIGSLFNVGSRQRDYDNSRYQSIVAVPILVDNHPRAWGVVTATSDRRDHFTPDASGIQNAEGARILAGAIALFVAMQTRLDNRSSPA